MVYVVFLYNLVLIILFAVCFAICMAQYFSHNSKLYFWLGAVFFSYILDCIFLYMNEFLSFPLYESSAMNMEPALRSVVLCANIFFYRMVVRHAVNAPLSRTEWACWMGFGFFGFVFPFLPFNNTGRWFYAFIMAIPLFWLLGVGVRRLQQKATLTRQDRILRGAMVAFLLAQVTSLGEECFRLVTGRMPLQFSTLLAERRVSVELGSIALAVLTLYYFAVQTRMPQSQSTSPPPAPPPVSDELLRQFAERFALTSREREILPLLLERKTNQEIGEQLFISPGTVKAHVHNIFVKADVGKRSELYKKVVEKKVG